MSKLVKRSQQVLSIRETIEKINQDLVFLTEQLKEIAAKGDAGQMSKDEIRNQMIKIQLRFETLKKQKTFYLDKYTDLQKNEKRKQDVGAHGIIEFYNLVLSYKLPRKENSSPVFIKIYEVPRMPMGQSIKSASVGAWVVALSGVSPSDSENYFSSKKPTQRMQGVHTSSGEIQYHEVPGEVAELIENYAAPLKLAVESISLEQQLPCFDAKKLSDIKSKVEKTISNISREYEPEEIETTVEPEEAKPGYKNPMPAQAPPNYNHPEMK